MNINFLPSKIKENIKKNYSDKTILNAVRSSTTINGESGEGYLIDLNDKFIFMSRRTGETDFSIKEFTGEIIGKILKDNFNIYLDISFPPEENKYQIKFSTLEETDLAKIAEKLLTVSTPKNTQKSLQKDIMIEENSGKDNTMLDNNKNNPDTRIKLQPIILLGAGMMYIAKSDQLIAKEEDFYVISMLNYNKELLKKSLEYFKTTNYETFLSDCKILTSEQKLCILANMLEIAMKDTKFDTLEQKMINSFVKNLEINAVEYETIRNVLLVKNKISIF